MKTTIAKNPGEDREWILVDAADKPLGRLAAALAGMLRGKDRPSYTPHVDTGIFVVVINADKVKLTGRKESQKIYARFSGYRHGLKEMTAAELRSRHPDRLVKLAVWGMLPDNQLSRACFRRLKVFGGEKHSHEAQKPVKREVA